MAPRRNFCFGVIAIFVVLVLLFNPNHIDAKDLKDLKKDLPTKGNPCIARLQSKDSPLYYTCPRPNESEKKSYCCYLDKCCEYKEFLKQLEQQYNRSQSSNYGYIAKGAIGSILKVLLWSVFICILAIIGCCCLSFFLCKKKKLFQGGIFSSPLPAQPPGPSPFARPTNPYLADQWPPENAPAPPPAYPTPAPSYPPYPQYPVTNIGAPAPPYNPNFR